MSLPIRLAPQDEENSGSKLHRIGFGQCGLVYGDDEHKLAIKVARKGFEDGLRNDMMVHTNVRRSLQEHRALCQVPEEHRFIPKYDTHWWGENRHRFGDVEENSSASSSGFVLPGSAIVSERILPLHESFRTELIRRYCPRQVWQAAWVDPTNRDCLAHLFLGQCRTDRRAGPFPRWDSPNFTLRNFNLYLDQMVALKMPVFQIASAMGEALATLHWAAKVDGFGIEFVIGHLPSTKTIYSAPRPTYEQWGTQKSETDLAALGMQMWMLDFDLSTIVNPIICKHDQDAVIAQYVNAFFENDPYFPLPMHYDHLEKKLWRVFSSSYLSQGEMILKNEPDKTTKLLPKRFIGACVLREMRMLNQNKGHGYREKKV